MSLILYDLAGADPARRFSPYCWRVRLAIEHKGLSVETIPWRFTDKDVIAFSVRAVHLSSLIQEKPWLAHGRSQITSNRLIRNALPYSADRVGRYSLDTWSSGAIAF
jgi:hypothetical protein